MAANSKSATETETTCTSKAMFLSIPAEIQLEIIGYLPYPDLLALKSTHKTFKQIITPTLNVVRRVEWLIERATMGLDFPHLANLNLRDDRVFAANPEVRRILRRRRFHEDCRMLARAPALAFGSMDLDEYGGDIVAGAGTGTGTDVDVDVQAWGKMRETMRCSINPTAGPCVGVQRAMMDINPAYRLQIIARASSSIATARNGSRLRKVLEVLIDFFLFCLLRPVEIVLHALARFHRWCLRQMFGRWTWFEAVEAMVVVVLLAYVPIGFDLQGSSQMFSKTVANLSLTVLDGLIG